MSRDDTPRGALDIGKVIQDLFGVLGRNFVTFLILAVILVGLPALLSGYLSMTFLRAGKIFAWQTTLGGLLGFVGLFVLQGTVVYVTVNDLNGKPAPAGAALSVGLSNFLPLLVIGILSAVATGLAAILLVFPAFMLMTAWIVAAPAYVAERRGVMSVFGRSADLTRGNRWRIFGLLLIYFVALLIIEALAGVFGNASRIASGAGIPMIQALVLLPLIQIASGMLTSAGVAAIYVQLRGLHDGVGTESLAAVFD